MKKLLGYTLLIFFCSCNVNSKLETKQYKNKVTEKISERAYSIQSVLWVQQSAEYKALCYQAFKLAKIQLNEILSKNAQENKPLAIIVDIDETILNNSPFNGKLIELNTNFNSELWNNWVDLEQAEPIPGSLDFLKYAETKGVKTFYVSNRKVDRTDETLSNLQKFGFPFADKSHIYLKNQTSSKEERRQAILADHSVVMLIGDNLSDFSELFDKKSSKERDVLVSSLNEKFGQEFIVLPNPMYGDWETQGIYDGNYNWSTFQKDSIRRENIKSF